MSNFHLFLLALTALIAGFVDAIAGGGGLLTLPALLLAGLPPSLALGTNKGQSVFGSGVALTRFYHSPLLDRQRIWPAFFSALVGAAIGVQLVTLLPRTWLTPLVMALLAALAVFMIFYRPPQTHAAAAPLKHPVMTAMGIAFGLAAYDGFFGPGTGTFLIMASVIAFHDPLDNASANAKVVNFASNLAALLVFACKGLVDWKVALPMAVGQSLGGYLGAHATIRHGRQLVRYAVLFISLALLLRLTWQFFRG